MAWSHRVNPPTTPAYDGPVPPSIYHTRFADDRDKYRLPTVKRLVLRGSWPKNGFQPNPQQIVEANAELHRRWLARRAPLAILPAPNPALSSSSTSCVEKPMPAESADEAAVEKQKREEKEKKKAEKDKKEREEKEKKAKAEAEAVAEAKRLEELTKQIRAEVLAEQEKAAKEKAEAEAAAKAKADEEAKMKAEVGKAAVAAFVAEQTAKKVDCAMSTRQTYCYHECGNHACSNEPMMDGKPTKKEKSAKPNEETKDKAKDENTDKNASKSAKTTYPEGKSEEQNQVANGQVQEEDAGPPQPPHHGVTFANSETIASMSPETKRGHDELHRRRQTSMTSSNGILGQYQTTMPNPLRIFACADGKLYDPNGNEVMVSGKVSSQVNGVIPQQTGNAVAPQPPVQAPSLLRAVRQAQGTPGSNLVPEAATFHSSPLGEHRVSPNVACPTPAGPPMPPRRDFGGGNGRDEVAPPAQLADENWSYGGSGNGGVASPFPTYNGDLWSSQQPKQPWYE